METKYLCLCSINLDILKLDPCLATVYIFRITSVTFIKRFHRLGLCAERTPLYGLRQRVHQGRQVRLTYPSSLSGWVVHLLRPGTELPSLASPVPCLPRRKDVVNRRLEFVGNDTLSPKWSLLLYMRQSSSPKWSLLLYICVCDESHFNWRVKVQVHARRGLRGLKLALVFHVSV